MSIKKSEGINLKKLYDDKYEGDYMGQDTYGLWAHKGFSLIRVKETLEQIPIKPEKVLDYGCGQGSWIDLQATIFPEAKIYGIDISGTAIEKAKRRFANFHFNVFDGDKAPFPNESFDLVFSYHVLEHVYDIDVSIQDISRLIKKGGYAVIIFPCGNEKSLLETIVNWMEDSKKYTADGRTAYWFEIPGGHLRRMTSQETITLFKKANLSIIKEYYSSQFFGTIDWLCRAKGLNFIKELFHDRKPTHFLAKVKLNVTRNILVALAWIINKKNLKLTQQKNIAKQFAVLILQLFGKTMEKFLEWSAILEWRFSKHRPNGSTQFLIFQKPLIPLGSR